MVKRLAPAIALCVLLTGCGGPTPAAEPGNPFVLVLIDKKTEEALGPFPYDREIVAEAVERSVELGARGVVLKFFMPAEKSEHGDRRLAEAMATTKVIIEAGNKDAPGPNVLPDKFKFGPVGNPPKAQAPNTG